MPHRNAAERAHYLRALADTLPALDLNQALGSQQIINTLREIADYLDETEPAGGPPDTLWVTIHGPALWYFNNEDDTLTQVRLDKQGHTGLVSDPLRTDVRERGLCAALVRVAYRRFEADIDPAE